MDDSQHDPRYLQGIEHFNACEFFEAHEVWEDIWQDEHGPSRKFYQGLIQAAVALHHFGNGNVRGARKLFFGFQGYLAPYRPRHLDLDVEKFLADMQRCFAPLASAAEDFPQLELDPELIPEIHLETPGA
jgi:predicted metal-dependent hydrolase